MSGKIILIGGGNFEKGETLLIDQKVLSLTKKKEPTILMIPAAMKDDQGYGKRFKQYFRKLQANPSVLRLWHTKLSKEEVYQMFLQTDIIYLGAGSTLLLKEAIVKWELIPILQQAYQKGTIIVGISAGANILCSYGYSDIQENEYQMIQGIGLLPFVFTPHAQKRPHFLEEASKHSLKSLALNDKEFYIYPKENH